MKTEEDFHASPKKQKPLKEKLASLSKKIHEAQYAVRDKEEQVIGFVSFELYHRIRAQERNKAIDACIELLLDQLEDESNTREELRQCSDTVIAMEKLKV